jgi:hypothetical protein
MKKLARFRLSYSYTPLVLALLVLISYAVTLPFIGFFMDDWYLIWFKHIFGALQFPTYFAIDRPLMAYFYIAANFLLGNSESPLVWQIFGLFTRWLTVFALWGFLNTLWPKAKKQNMLVAILAAVFPGFTQQWIAIIYSFFFTCLAGFFFSLTLMLKAIREPKRFWVYTILSLIIGVYSYAASEFYFGLELIRPVVLWIEYSRNIVNIPHQIWKTLKSWGPFLAAFLGFAVWRGFFFVSTNHGVTIMQQIRQSLLGMLSSSLQKTYQAGIDAVFNSWVNPLNLSNYPSKGKTPLLIFGIVLLVFVGLIIWLFYLAKKNPQEIEPDNSSWQKEAFWLGLISLIVAVIPFIAADLPISTEYPFDRFLLAYLFGSCLLLVVLSDKTKFGLCFIAFLTAVAAGYQISNSIYYKNLYQQQSDFFWQLSWRAPQIQKNTALITEDLPFSELFSSGSLTAPLNMIYDSELEGHEIPYMMILFPEHKELVPVFSPDSPISYTLRSFVFKGNTSSVLVYKKPADGCLRIFSSTDSADEFQSDENDSFWKDAIPLSNLDLILVNPTKPAVLPQKYFGKENTNQWCYYFEKADLALQQSKWQDVIDYYVQANEKGFAPLNADEWVPLIEAYANSNQVQKASDISNNLNLSEAPIKDIVCSTWFELEKQITNSKDQDLIKHVISNLQCQNN